MRRDWWRFWVSTRGGQGVMRNAVAITIATGSKERTIGYRRKNWKDN